VNSLRDGKKVRASAGEKNAKSVHEGSLASILGEAALYVFVGHIVRLHSSLKNTGGLAAGSEV
jgi:hypothetical protein